MCYLCLCVLLACYIGLHVLHVLLFVHVDFIVHNVAPSSVAADLHL